ncbi:MAG: CE1759 family FMN reductase [Nocardioides sp.]
MLGRVGAADGLVVVTPIFSASYSGLFKTFVDVLEDGTLEGTPVLLAATGGTARHSLALDYAVRPLFGYLRATVAPTTVFAAGEGFGSSGGGTSLSARIDRAAGELADLVLNRRVRSTTDPFAEPIDFADLLNTD